jgi:hypothetical protein
MHPVVLLYSMQASGAPQHRNHITYPVHAQ